MRFTSFCRLCLALTFVWAFGFNVVKANDIFIHTAPAMIRTAPGLGANEVFIEFGVRWENSWRVFHPQTGLTKWDAAWVFVKWAPMTSVRKGPWRHVYVDTNRNNHQILASSDPARLDVGTTNGRGMGVFVYRTDIGTGPFSVDTMRLRWNYSGLGITDLDSIDFRIFGVEMVYVPEGPFMMGDGAPRAASFSVNATYPALWNPTTGANTNNLIDGPYLGPYDGTQRNNRRIDESTTYRGTSIPAAFPRGLKAIYVMKHPITQRAYVDFLNTLETGQQAARTWISPFTSVQPTAPLAVGPNAVSGVNSAATYRNFIRLRRAAQIVGLGDTIPALYGHSRQPGVTNWRFAENGGYIACNFLNIWDGLAYADWAGLRPMTEMEFEKICRGPGEPILGALAWGQRGSSNVAQGVDHEFTGLEQFFSGNFQPLFGELSPDGRRYYVVRVGSFAHANSGRYEAGAAYYGALHMSDNVWERVISLDGGLGFTGEHGDGVLTASGEANTPNWPTLPLSTNPIKFGSRGYEISNRTWVNPVAPNYLGAPEYLGARTTGATYANYGFRAVRTAP